MACQKAVPVFILLNMFAREMTGIRWVALITGIVSLILGVAGLVTGEAVEPSTASDLNVHVRTLADNEPAFAAVILWRFVIAIGCFLFLWSFRERRSEWY